MSSISVRFNSFLFFYSVFNDHKSGHCPVVGLDGLEPSSSYNACVVAYPGALLRAVLVNSHSSVPTGRSGWTRTIDLALIRRAL